MLIYAELDLFVNEILCLRKTFNSELCLSLKTSAM